MTRRSSDGAARRPVMSVPVAYAVLMMALSMALTAGAAVWIADRAARQSEQRWCGLVSTLDDTYRRTPPQTEAGRRVAAEIARLRGEFDCRLRRL